MKVGDLVKALTGHYMSSNILALDGKLGVIVDEMDLPNERPRWQIVFTSGASLWLRLHELELVSESR